MQRHGLAEDGGVQHVRAEQGQERDGGEARRTPAHVRGEGEERRGGAGEEERRPAKQILMLRRAVVAYDLAAEGDVEVVAVELRVAVEAGAVDESGGEDFHPRLGFRAAPLDLVNRQR